MNLLDVILIHFIWDVIISAAHVWYLTVNPHLYSQLIDSAGMFIGFSATIMWFITIYIVAYVD